MKSKLGKPPGCRSRRRPRTSDWSSATSTRIMRGRRRAGAGAQDEAPSICRPGGHLAAVDLDALADARPARARGRRCLAVPTPSSRTSSSQLRGLVANGHVGLAGASVLEHVRQGLLHDPVGGEIDPRRQRHRRPLDVHADGQARSADLAGERRRGRRGRVAVRGRGCRRRCASRRAGGASRRARCGRCARRRGARPRPRPARRAACGGRRQPAAPSRSPSARRCRAARGRCGRAPRPPRSVPSRPAPTRPRSRALPPPLPARSARGRRIRPASRSRTGAG